MWHLGSTFLGNVIEKPYEHLHIVLSDPYDSKDKKVVVVTFMSTFNGESNSEEDFTVAPTQKRFKIIQKILFLKN